MNSVTICCFTSDLGYIILKAALMEKCMCRFEDRETKIMPATPLHFYKSVAVLPDE